MELRAEVAVKSVLSFKRPFASITAKKLPFSAKSEKSEISGGKASGREIYAAQTAKATGFSQFRPVPPNTVFTINTEKALKIKTKTNPIPLGIKKPISRPEIIISRDKPNFEEAKYLSKFSTNNTPITAMTIFNRA